MLERRFSERQFVPEDAAIGLAAIGTPAAPKLVELLAHEDPWIRINAPTLWVMQDQRLPVHT